MVFTSPVFLFYFLALFIFVYGGGLAAKKICTLTQRRNATVPAGIAKRLASFWLCNLVILLFSLVFYYWDEGDKIFLLIGVIAVNYIMALRIEPARQPDERKRRNLFIACLAINIGCLVVFKYLGFFLSLVDGAFGLGMRIPKIALPLGISFFIFQAMSYVIDVYRGNVAANRSVTNFGCYIAMFPQLVAGPIVRYVHIAEQLKSRFISVDKFASGVERFIFGLAKKVLVANHVALFADACFALQPERVTTTVAWMGTLCYAVQIYFDFSGYSDMAIGLGRMLGFDFRENFNHPYAAISMQDFWRRWHISLSSWFRDYVYIPLGGNRNGNIRTYVNLCVVFLLCGLWHGASVNFMLWGLYHGGFLTFERVTRIHFGKFPMLGRAYVWVAFLFGWVLFRAEDFGRIAAFYSAMTGWVPARADSGYVWLWCTPDVRVALGFGIILSFPVMAWVRGIARGRIPDWMAQTVRVAGLVILLGLCVPFIIGDSYNPFIYFRF